MTVSSRVKGRESAASSLLSLGNVSRIKVKYENSQFGRCDANFDLEVFSRERGIEQEEKEGGGERHSKMKGQQKKRGNYWSFLMEMVMKWDMGLGTMGGRGRLSVTV